MRERESFELLGVFDEQADGQALLERVERGFLREVACLADDPERDAAAERGGDAQHIAADRRQE